MDVNFLEPQIPYQGQNKKKMIRIIFFCLVFGGALVGTTWAGAKIFNTNSTINDPAPIAPVDTTTFWGKVQSLFVSDNKSVIGFENDRVNIALYGIGGAGHDGAQLTDTILLVSLKPSAHRVAMVSVPRDTVVNIPGFGWRKINEANAMGEVSDPGSGGKLATETLQNFLGIDIPYFVRVDFNGFEKIINELGGVEVFVDKPFTDAEYPTNDYKIKTISFAKGWQNMSGETALQYARSRHGNNFEGSDFARARRQQKILLAVRDKLLSTETLLHPARIASVLRTLDEHIQTNIRFNDLMEFLQLGKDIDTGAITHLVFSDDPASVLMPDTTSGAFYLRPKDPTLNQIHALVQNIFDEEVSAKAKTLVDYDPLIPKPTDTTRIEIQNGTWRPGFAARQKNKLESEKYTVAAVGNAALRPLARAQIFNVTKKHPETFAALKKKYDAEEIFSHPPVSPDLGTEPSNIDIIVILGENVADIAE